MKLRTNLSIFLLAPFCLTAEAGVTGKCAYSGKTLAFVDAHAALVPDPFEETKKVTKLWFVTKALDRAAMANAKSDDVDDAITAHGFEHDSATLSLRLDVEGKVVEAMQLYVPPGSNRSVSGNDVGDLTVKAAMTTRATGRWVLSDDDDLKCNLQFDVPIGGKGPPPPAPKPWGTALPKGGGEPGKVYMAMHRATKAGDIDAMLATATKDRADEMRKARSQPEFPAMIKMIQAFEPSEVSVVSGRADANRAELQIAGKDSDGSAMTGEVKLVREAGAWKIEKVSTKSTAGQ